MLSLDCTDKLWFSLKLISRTWFLALEKQMHRLINLFFFFDSLLTNHNISKPQSACERDELTQLLMHLEWNIFIKLVQEAVMPSLNYSFIIAEQQPACGLWNPEKIRCLHISKCWKPLLLSSWKMLSSVVIY